MKAKLTDYNFRIKGLMRIFMLEHKWFLSDFTLQFLATVRIPKLNIGLDNSPLINEESLVYRQAPLHNQFTIVIKMQKKKNLKKNLFSASSC